MKSITQKELFLIGVAVFGKKNSPAEIERKLKGSNTPSYFSAGEFSVSNFSVAINNPRQWQPKMKIYHKDRDFSLREMSAQYLIFPEAKSYLEYQLKLAKKTLKPLEKSSKDINMYAFQRYPKPEDNFKREMHATLLKVYLEPHKMLSEAIIKRNTLLLRERDFNVKPLLNIQKAKQFPISNLIEFRQNKAKCIFHNDTNPSMQYYPKANNVYCFSCNAHGDSIAVYQKLNNCSFKEAVLKLQ